MKILKCEQVIHKNVIFLKTSQWYANCDKNENVSTTELSSNNVCDNLIHGLVHVFHSFDSAHRVSLLKCYPTIVSLFPFSFICWLGGLQAATCFTADLTFLNVIFPINVYNAPFLGSIPLAFFVTKLAGEF